MQALSRGLRIHFMKTGLQKYRLCGVLSPQPTGPPGKILISSQAASPCKKIFDKKIRNPLIFRPWNCLINFF
jgi:hypothetical protein